MAGYDLHITNETGLGPIIQIIHINPTYPHTETDQAIIEEYELIPRIPPLIACDNWGYPEPTKRGVLSYAKAEYIRGYKDGTRDPRSDRLIQAYNKFIIFNEQIILLDIYQLYNCKNIPHKNIPHKHIIGIYDRENPALIPALAEFTKQRPGAYVSWDKSPQNQSIAHTA
jgi:hypothetical protein